VDSVKWPKVIVQVSYYGFTEEYTSCLSIDGKRQVNTILE